MESMASREDGLASLCSGYPPILTHAENTLSLSNWQPIQSPMVWPIIFLDKAVSSTSDSHNNS